MAVPQVSGLSPCVRVRLHGDGPGVMIRYHHCFGSGHVRLPCHALLTTELLECALLLVGVILQRKFLAFDIFAISCFYMPYRRYPITF